jgi:transcriptional regulator with XRE-family HTH domain
MHYPNEAIIAALKAARERSGFSQRDLSAKAGVPQSHISKIESCWTDIRLSSLIELARALDLELTLVPRKLVPAVRGILREAPPPVSPAAKNEVKELNRAARTVARLARRHPETPGLDKLRQTLRELGHLPLSRNVLDLITTATKRLMAVADGHEAATAVPEIRNTLQNLRNRIVHCIAEPQKPAYSLEEDDG